MNRKFFSLPLDNLKFEKSSTDSMTIKMYAISDGVNRNECEFMLESFSTAIPTIYNKPILAYFNEKTQDTESHNVKLKLDVKTGEYYYDYNYPEAEKPVGVIPESALISIEKYEDKNWIVIDGGIIWTSYNRSLSRIIKRQLKKKVSVEIEVLESYMEDDVEKITSFRFLGITILGKTSDGLQEVSEGIENAHMQLITFAESDRFKKYSKCFEYAQKHEFKQIDSLGEDIEETKIPILSEIKEYMQNFINGMSEFPSKPSEFIEISAEAMTLLANEDISLDGAKILINKIEKYMDEGNMLIANMIGGEKMLSYLKQFDEEQFIEKDKIGTGEKLKTSLTKKSASNDPWSDVNKTKLRNDLLEKSNYKDLIKKCYLVVEEGWEDAPSENLKYPVCQIKNDTLVYNINGCQAARSRLEQNTDASYYKSATSKLDKIYSKLGLDEDKKHLRFKEVNRQMKEKIMALFADKNEYEYISNAENSILAFSLKDNKFVIIPFEKSEDEDEHIMMKEEMAKDAEIYAKSVYEDTDGDKEEDDEEEFGCGKEMAEEFSKFSRKFKNSDEVLSALESSFSKKYDGDNWFYVKAYDEENKYVYIYCDSQTFRYEYESETYDIKLDTKTEVRVSTEYVVIGESFAIEKVKEELKAMEEDVKEAKKEKAEMAKEISEFKAEKFAKIIETYSEKFSMTDEEKGSWNEKTKTFSDFKEFEKELVFEFKDRLVKQPEHLVTEFEKNRKSTNTKKSAIERLKEKQNQ